MESSKKKKEKLLPPAEEQLCQKYVIDKAEKSIEKVIPEQNIGNQTFTQRRTIVEEEGTSVSLSKLAAR